MPAGNYDILFESVPIGPVVAKNRFYQVPHCNGMGHRDPTALAYMRGVKAEGGWAVVCTEEVEIHPTSDIAPYIELRLWDDRDVPALAAMAEKIHEHGALAGIELCHNGLQSPNMYSREVPLAPTGMPVASANCEPVSAKTMDKEDIRQFRRWHHAAALRSKQAGFDLVYVYGGHALGFFHYFISRRYNHRTDEYGGSLENRIRLLKEILFDTKDSVGDACAVPCRISVDELLGPHGLEKAEIEDAISMLADIPDLWDLCLASWENDSQTSRFAEEGYQEPFIKDIKSLTTKPVVGVGRYTSPDRMAALVRQGVVDFIGAARPSIADPFLPTKIKEGRLDDIRECIGCNICVSGDLTMTPLRCTQNPSMGEEWRSGWHPEYIRPKESDRSVLVVGAGPAGLEAAHALGKRGYEVALAEAGKELGGRVVRESRLPGLAAWIRVRDYRMLQFRKLPNVEIFYDSELSADDILSFDYPRIAIATGSKWRSDGTGRHATRPIPISREALVFTPDDIMDGRLPDGGNVFVWDDDHYYMGGVIAEMLVQNGCSVTYGTPAAEASVWSKNTLEQRFIQRKLLNLGVTILPHVALENIQDGEAEISCVFTHAARRCAADSIVLVTARQPNDELGIELMNRKNEWDDKGIESVTMIGDALAPATIAHAVYAGRRYAEEFDKKRRTDDSAWFKRELPELHQ